MYKSICGSWLFNAAHFTARLVETKYAGRMEERTPHWMHFIKEWLPERYPDRQDSMSQSADLRAWYAQTRTNARDKIFTMFPQVAEQYYIKRGAHMKELEEHRLRGLIMQFIPEGVHGWKDDFPQPPISVKKELPIVDAGELTPPLTPTIPVEYPVKILLRTLHQALMSCDRRTYVFTLTRLIGRLRSNMYHVHHPLLCQKKQSCSVSLDGQNSTLNLVPLVSSASPVPRLLTCTGRRLRMLAQLMRSYRSGLKLCGGIFGLGSPMLTSLACGRRGLRRTIGRRRRRGRKKTQQR